MSYDALLLDVDTLSKKKKLYSKYGKLIYMEARNGWDMDGNLKLRAPNKIIFFILTPKKTL